MNSTANSPLMRPSQSNGFTSSFMTNPIIRKLGRVQETAAEGQSATYGGICAKTVYFLLLTVGGIALLLVLKGMHPFTSVEDTAPVLLMVLLGAAVFTIITPLVAWIIRPAIPLFGTLYCVSQGFLLGYLCSIAGAEYTHLAWLALLITIIIVATMLFLYRSGRITITRKFNSTMKILFFSTVGGGIALSVLKFIPATSGITNAVLDNPIISIGGSLLFVIIASLFLLSDFDAIEKTVEHHLPKKYEWSAAFGLVFTVIWLYLKVLSLLEKTKSRD